MNPKRIATLILLPLLPLVASAQQVKLDGANAIQYKQVGDTKLFLHIFEP